MNYFSEVLRVRTPVVHLISRKALSKVVVGGLKIARNAFLRAIISGPMIDKKYWSDPE